MGALQQPTVETVGCSFEIPYLYLNAKGLLNQHSVKLTLATCIGLAITLVTMSCTNISHADAKLYGTVKSDFKIRYPGFEFMECSVGEGDLAVAYVHINYRKNRIKKSMKKFGSIGR